MTFLQGGLVVIIGAGTMGRQAALWVAGCGYQVILVDTRQEAIDAARKFHEAMYTHFPVITEHPNILSRITYLSGGVGDNHVREVLESASVIWEFTPEKVQVKRDLYTLIGDVAPESALILSGTSAIRAEEIFGGLKIAPQSLKVHPFAFFPIRIEGAELVSSSKTTLDTAGAAWDFTTSLRLYPLEVRNDPIGQAMNYLWQLIKEGSLIRLAGGNCSAKEFDVMYGLLTGSNHGPAGLMEHVGLGLVEDITEFYANSDTTVNRSKEALRAVREIRARGDRFYRTRNGWRHGHLPTTRAGVARQLPFLLAAQLEGDWTLKEMKAIGPDGATQYYPLGKDASGILTYTRSGRVSVQLQRNSPLESEPSIPLSLQPLTGSGYLSYGGKFWIEGLDTAKAPNTIVHLTDIGSTPEIRGKILRRHYYFDPNGNLVLDTPRDQYGDKGTVVRLIWEPPSPF